MVLEQEKELRFTRLAQGKLFFFLASIPMITFFVWMLAVCLPKPYGARELLVYAPAALCLLFLTVILLKLALHCTRHAYLIFTPLGIEIFPLFFAKKHLRLLGWSEIADYELLEKQLVLHTNKEHTAGVIVSLRPLPKKQHATLEQVLKHRLSKKN